MIKNVLHEGGGKVTMESDEISSNSEILSWHITLLNLYCTVYTLYFCVHSPFSPSLINCLFTNIIQSSVRRRRERKEKVWRFYVLCIISITRIPSCLFYINFHNTPCGPESSLKNYKDILVYISSITHYMLYNLLHSISYLKELWKRSEIHFQCFNLSFWTNLVSVCILFSSRITCYLTSTFNFIPQRIMKNWNPFSMFQCLYIILE